MTFLAKVGSILVKAAAIAAGFAPMISAAVPGAGGVVQTVVDKLSQVVDAVVQVEGIGQTVGLNGAQKAAAVAPLVAQILLDFCHIRGWQIADEAKLKAAAQTIGGGIADFLNAVHPDSAKAIDVKK
jgi:type IV secretory pathway TrbF-like protein